jgi:hypothetical protein
VHNVDAGEPPAGQLRLAEPAMFAPWRYDTRGPTRSSGGTPAWLTSGNTAPMSVVVSYDGVVDSNTLTRFRNGMEKASASVMGRKIMALMHSAGFEAVPANYDAQLADFVKRYPPQSPGLKIEKLLPGR